MNDEEEAFFVAGAMMVNSFISGYKNIPKNKKRVKPVFGRNGERKGKKRGTK